jgi:hypothetical protein
MNKKGQDGIMSNYVIIAIVLFGVFLAFYFILKQTNVFKSLIGIE